MEAPGCTSQLAVTGDMKQIHEMATIAGENGGKMGGKMGRPELCGFPSGSEQRELSRTIERTEQPPLQQ
jgi:hypothetical protein